MSVSIAAKTCHVCGRVMHPRKRWSDIEAVKYCSAGCRKRRHPKSSDLALEAAILELLATRARGKTICPSEAARFVGDAATWRDLMPRTRDAARRLVARGLLEITQGGQTVEPSTAKGAIRLRLPKN